MRLLLADALESEETWEKQLLSNASDYSGGLLLRYGQTVSGSLPASRSVVPVLQVPSSILQRHNIEILISAIQSAPDGISLGGPIPLDTLLSPIIGTPADANGRQITLSQPVHSTVLVGNGLDELMVANQILSSTSLSPVDQGLVRLVVNLPNFSAPQPPGLIIFDADKAETALTLVRDSLGKAAEYTEKWNESGLPALSRWLTLAASEGNPLSTAVRNLVSSILSNASFKSTKQTAQAHQLINGRMMGPATQASLEDAVASFSRSAHQELQSGLSSAWSSRNWRKLAWYKLFWRVDDVGLIINDIVSNTWLPRTERAVYELSGRMIQTGISPLDFDIPASTNEMPAEPVPSLQRNTTLVDAVDPITTGVQVDPVLVNAGGTVVVEMQPSRQPIPIASTVSRRRQAYMNNAISELTSTAQQLVFRTLSITGFSAGLSGLAYFSLTPGSLYEAGTIVAVGTVVALRRMQTGWQRSCKIMEEGLMQTGREVIRELTEKMLGLIRNAAIAKEDDFEIRSRRDAASAIAQAQEALQQV